MSNLKNIFAVYKPKGPTSHDIVDQVRKITGIRKVGHAGTLDPLAEGVLVIAVGREATKQISEIVKEEKEYLAVIKLGETSTTDDSEGTKTRNTEHKTQITNEKIKEVVQKFVGEIEQTPPIYSAIKIKGQEAYKLARKGKEVEMKSRQVLIKEIEIKKFEWPFLEIRVVTGPGVYIRSLARDIGQELGCGGYLYYLKRTRVGDFTEKEAIKDLNETKKYAAYP